MSLNRGSEQIDGRPHIVPPEYVFGLGLSFGQIGRGPTLFAKNLGSGAAVIIRPVDGPASKSRFGDRSGTHNNKVTVCVWFSSVTISRQAGCIRSQVQADSHAGQDHAQVIGGYGVASLVICEG